MGKNITLFEDIYKAFFTLITPKMYVAMDENETVESLQNILINSLYDWEYPKKNIFRYEKNDPDIIELWIEENGVQKLTKEIEDSSYFYYELNQEEIKIIATLMVITWLSQQITNQDNIDMMISGGSNAKIGSQGNHVKMLEQLKKDWISASKIIKSNYSKRKFNNEGIAESCFGDITLTNEEKEGVVNGKKYEKQRTKFRIL